MTATPAPIYPSFGCRRHYPAGGAVLRSLRRQMGPETMTLRQCPRCSWALVPPPIHTEHYRVCQHPSHADGCDVQVVPGLFAEANLRIVITLVRLARVLLILLLASFAMSFVIGVGSSETGAVEKVALLALFAGCVALAAKFSTFAARAHERLQRQ